MADRIGQRYGNYRLVRPLGQGGFGVVYQGQHITDQTLAAIKLLDVQLERENLRLFIQEASAIFCLKHAHIVQLLDFGISDDDIPFLALAYAPNGTLRQRHPRGTCLSLATLITYVTPIAEALQYVHEQKRVHCDVKPDNILLGPNDELWLSDFGITVTAASSYRSLRSPSDIGGTPYYMAPEQFRGYPEPASDQYALAVMIYEWLSGAPPFVAGDFLQLGYQHTHELAPPLGEKVPTLPPEVASCVMTALAKEPGRRFATIYSFALALQQASESVVSTEPGKALSRPFTPQASAFLSAAMTPRLQATVPARSPSSSSLFPLNHDVPHRPEPSPGPRRSSRRAILIGLAGLTLAGAAGAGIAWEDYMHLAPARPTSSPITPARTSSPSHPSSSSPPAPSPTTQSVDYHGHSSAVNAVAWSPDGTRIASASADKTVQVWNATDGKRLLTFRGHTQAVNAVAWSPDGTRIASASADTTVQVWNANTGGLLFTYRGHSDVVNAVAWSPDSTRIASAANDLTVQVWDAADGGNALLLRLSSFASSVAWSPDGTRIASGSADSTVQVWNASTGGIIFTYHGHKSWVDAVAWSPDSERIASGSWDETVQVWDAADGRNPFAFRKHTNFVNSVSWSPLGKRIASGDDNGIVLVWNAANGGNIFIHGIFEGAQGVAWSPDGSRLAAGSTDWTAYVWPAS
jgi:eukaryotic-like serine/threonine-protein kinase